MWTPAQFCCVCWVEIRHTVAPAATTHLVRDGWFNGCWTNKILLQEKSCASTTSLGIFLFLRYLCKQNHTNFNPTRLIGLLVIASFLVSIRFDGWKFTFLQYLTKLNVLGVICVGVASMIILSSDSTWNIPVGDKRNYIIYFDGPLKCVCLFPYSSRHR